MLLLLYLACCAVVLLVARALGRPIARPAAAVLVLLPAAFFLPAFLGVATPAPVDHCASQPPWSYLPHPVARNANMNDVARQTLPWAQAVRGAWTAGILPWRDPWNGCGTPLAGNGTSAPYAPWTLLSLLLAPAQALVFIAAWKLFLASTGGFLWLRELDLSPPSALLGAILIAFCLSMSLWLFWPQSAVLALWPWSLFSIERLVNDGSGSRRVWWTLVVTFFLWPLAGHIETAASGSAFLALWLAARLPFESRRIRAVLPRIAGAAAAAAGLSAFSLLPQGLAILASNRLALSSPTFWRPLLSAAPHGPAWPQIFLTTIFPRSLGDEIASPLLPGSPASFPELALGSIGLIGACLAASLLFPSRSTSGGADERRAAALLLPLGAALATASLTWPFGELLGLVPGLRYVLPLRLLTWAAVSAAALAAFGFERLCRREKDQPLRPVLVPAAVLAGAALAVFALFAPRHEAAGGLSSQLHSLAVTEAALIALILWFLLRAWRRFSRAAFLLGIAALACGELLFQGARFYRYGDARLLFPSTPLIEFLRGQPRPFRILGQGPVFYPNSNVFAGLEEIRVHDPSERRDYVEFLDRTCGYDPRPYFKDVRDDGCPALDFLNVKYLVARPGASQQAEKWSPVYRGPDGSVFENRRVLPRIFAPRTVVWLPTPSAGSSQHRNAVEQFGPLFAEVARLTDFGETAYVLGEPSGKSSNPAVEVRDYQENPIRISFRAVTDRPALLVSSIVQDGGWTARLVGGPSLPTFLADGPFLAVRVPAGDDRVVLTYTEPGFSWGAGLSVLTAAVLAVLAGLRALRRRSLEAR